MNYNNKKEDVLWRVFFRIRLLDIKFSHARIFRLKKANLWAVWNSAWLNCMVMWFFFLVKNVFLIWLSLVFTAVSEIFYLCFFCLTGGNLLVIFSTICLSYFLFAECWQIETICTKVILSLRFHLTLGASLSSSLLLQKWWERRKLRQNFFNSTMTNENCN